MSAGQFNQIDPNKPQAQDLINTDYRTYNFDVIDGINYKYDVTQPNKYDRDGNLVNPDAHRVQDLTYQGKPISDDQEFMVVTNNYRASGNFPGVRNASENRLLNLENRQVLILQLSRPSTLPLTRIGALRMLSRGSISTSARPNGLKTFWAIAQVFSSLPATLATRALATSNTFTATKSIRPRILTLRAKKSKGKRSPARLAYLLNKGKPSYKW